MKKIIKVVSVLGLMLSLCGCPPEPMVSNNFTADVPKIQTNNISSFKSLKMYIDFSGSMKGYVDFKGCGALENNIFREVVPSFLTKVESEYSISTTTECGDKIFNSPNALSDALAKSETLKGKFTLLDEFISQIADLSNDSTVTVAVSDMIMSGGLSEAKKEHKYNQQNLPTLKTKMLSVLTKVSKKGLDVVVLQYYSDYNGNYYCNSTENLEGGDAYKNSVMKNRPFYMMMIGKKEFLNDIVEKECVGDYENIYASYYFSQSDLESVECKIEQDKNTQFWVEGYTQGKPAGFYTSGNLTSLTTKFNVVIDNFILPKHLGRQNFKAECNNGSAMVRNYNAKDRKLEIEIETLPFDKLSKQTKVETSIYQISNDWMADASINDDVNKELSELEGKTWGFSTLLSAIDDAFHKKSEKQNEFDVCNVSFVLSKQ